MPVPYLRPRLDTFGDLQAVFAVDALTRMLAQAEAERVIGLLGSAVDARRPDSEISLLHAWSADEPLSAVVSPELGEILEHAASAQALTDGAVTPLVLEDAGDPQASWSYDPAERRLRLQQGVELDLWSLGCAWAAEEIVRGVVDQDPAATLVVIVGPAVAALGAAWEISEALGNELTVLDPGLRTGQRHFGLLDDVAGRQGSHRDHGRAHWERVVVGAEDAVQAVTLALAAQVQGADAPESIERHGAQAELVAARGMGRRRRVRTPGWAPAR